MPIAIVPDSSRAAAPACPSVQPDYSAEKKLGTCLKDAEAAQKNGSDEYTAAAYLEALKLAKLIYSAYSTQQDFKWTVSDSDAVVHYGTTGCVWALKVGNSEDSRLIRSLLEDCEGFASAHVRKLLDSGLSTEAKILKSAQERRELFATALKNLPVSDELVSTNPNGKVNESWPVTENSLRENEVKPPSNIRFDSLRYMPPDAGRGEQLPRSPKGLYAGLGISLSLSAAFITGFGINWSSGVQEFVSLNGSSIDCSAGLLQECRRHVAAKSLLYGTSFGIGISTASLATFSGLLLSEKSLRSPKRLKVGLGLSSAAAILSVVAFAFSIRRAATKREVKYGDCDDSCQDFARMQGLYHASAIGGGLSLAFAATFAGLLALQRRSNTRGGVQSERRVSVYHPGGSSLGISFQF